MCWLSAFDLRNEIWIRVHNIFIFGAIEHAMLMFIGHRKSKKSKLHTLPSQRPNYYDYFMEMRTAPPTVNCNLKTNTHEGLGKQSNLPGNLHAKMNGEEVAEIACQTSISFSTRFWHLTNAWARPRSTQRRTQVHFAYHNSKNAIFDAIFGRFFPCNSNCDVHALDRAPSRTRRNQ